MVEAKSFDCDFNGGWRWGLCCDYYVGRGEFGGYSKSSLSHLPISNPRDGKYLGFDTTKSNKVESDLLGLFCLQMKHRVKRSIKMPAISNKLADIPPLYYSWRKYGQKPIKGSPHPKFPIF
ncbi:hypothetical protein Patl1_14903 [Pistacia atlantica]|uniref:Uncharacterized protein n=1 Tax=Pistacia atlantica TaxID=434234 RepID=A0ACC1AXG9_9ROSI|nr:hypothetical protein Patl1_14903 [Pistacia atlantica]